MEKYLNLPIKELIAKFPKVGEILQRYNIGCVPCSVGSCLFKDIMEIHNLSAEDEFKLLSQIAKVIYPDREVVIPKISRKEKPKAGQLKYSPPLERLVDEHLAIKKLIALIPAIIENLDVQSEPGRKIIRQSLDFIRNYADKYHHAKEEEILFKYFGENLDILDVMRQDHESARAHVRSILEALDTKDKDTIAEHLKAYQELLSEHIKKEDEILYLWMDRNLSIAQVGELFTKFNEVEKTSNKEVIEACKKFVQELEERYVRPTFFQGNPQEKC